MDRHEPVYSSWTGVFGDIDTASHREWVERVASFGGTRAFLPLWQSGRAEPMLARFESHGVDLAGATRRRRKFNTAASNHTVVVDGLR